MIIRQFLAWTQDDSTARRAEAATHLARAFLYGGLDAEETWNARTALIGLLDDPSRQVRLALALACASAPEAPRALIIALASDQADIAAVVLARSPVLSDADLVDGIAIGCETVRSAIAARDRLSYAVAGALAELGEVPSLVALATNHEAEITTGSLLRMVARHGDAAPLREALLARPDLPLEVRQAITARLAETLAAFAVDSGWLTPVRSERASREARERATLTFSVDAHPIDLARLVTHLRRQGELNAGLILRAILSGRMAFVEAALCDLTGLGGNRVAGLMLDSSGAGFTALHRRAGLPEALLPAFSGALSAWREASRGRVEISDAALSRRMIERALTACEAMPFAEASGIVALLARYEAEAARDEARLVAKALGEVAQAEEKARIEAEVIDAEWRDAQARIAQAPDYADLEATAAPAADVAAPGSVAAILDGLSDALMREFAQGVERTPPTATTEDTIPDTLVASYRADRVRLAA
ncbi:DUF2336 domain-containing protein [Methylobacterium sp. Leaf466]|uniref:DUF2336 domain-containing protein n=1 Tax=Methylobacterium sp. Leaf466 TaxID=1736386 RepID=UPI0006FEB325|nr:DUF2336 domain-containing protein [Methylobacterium sp. Leaf466]KQT78703.1 hypothetical protein ASG59_05780 [Methylobacterium sp. Leaf466]